MTLGALFALVRRRWLPVLLCVLAGGAGAFAQAERSPELYVSQASLFVNIPAARSTQEQLQGLELSAQLIKSYAIIATSQTTAQRVKERLGLPDSAAAIASQISAVPYPGTVILVVGARSADPERARLVAQATAEVVDALISDLELDQARPGAVDAQVIEAAQTPRAPVGPESSRSAVVGLLLGALVGVAVGAGVDALDRSVKAREDVEALSGAPVLASIPRFRAPGGSEAVVADAPSSSAAEAYRALRTALRFLELDQPIRTLVVTSAREGEGKTTSALNLALALAQSGERVALVDADLRRGRLAESLGLPGVPGVTDVALGSVELEEALQNWRDTLFVLPAGSTPPNPAELLGSERVAAVLAELARRFDIVVIDTPPVLNVTDAVVLGAHADAVLLVARHGRVHRAQLVEATHLLDGVGAGLVGSVLNAVPGRPGELNTGPRRKGLATDRVDA